MKNINAIANKTYLRTISVQDSPWKVKPTNDSQRIPTSQQLQNIFIMLS